MGAPNVGKSSLVQLLSSGLPEVCDYPFTTRSIKVGHFFVDGMRHQVGHRRPARAGRRQVAARRICGWKWGRPTPSDQGLLWRGAATCLLASGSPAATLTPYTVDPRARAL